MKSTENDARRGEDEIASEAMMTIAGRRYSVSGLRWEPPKATREVMKYQRDRDTLSLPGTRGECTFEVKLDDMASGSATVVMNTPDDTPAPCPHTAPEEHAQAGAQCERGAHEQGHHRVAPRDGKPGAVWADRRVWLVPGGPALVGAR